MKDQPTVNGMNADHFNQSALLVKSQTNLPFPRDANRYPSQANATSHSLRLGCLFITLL